MRGDFSWWGMSKVLAGVGGGGDSPHPSVGKTLDISEVFSLHWETIIEWYSKPHQITKMKCSVKRVNKVFSIFVKCSILCAIWSKSPNFFGNLLIFSLSSQLPESD